VFPRVEGRHLQAVLVLAEEMNFTRAAERLHITQFALSKQINEIEKHHGFNLFTRKNRRNVNLAKWAQRQQQRRNLFAIYAVQLAFRFEKSSSQS
jgi:hypothetical protein